MPKLRQALYVVCKYIMTLQTSFLIFFLGTISNSFGQLTLQKMCQQVLTENKIDQPKSFDNSNKINGHDETILNYLGSVKSHDGRIFKILTYAYIWGPNHHTSGSIYVYNNKNNYVGQYHLGDARDLPVKLRNGILIFTNVDNGNCDKNITTTISLNKGLPKNIFIKCKSAYGDLYSFSCDN
jgi:hypothetical protein